MTKFLPLAGLMGPVVRPPTYDPIFLGRGGKGRDRETGAEVSGAAGKDLTGFFRVLIPAVIDARVSGRDQEWEGCSDPRHRRNCYAPTPVQTAV